MDATDLERIIIGSSRYNEFQRALSRISPTLLAKRLKQLENVGIILRKKQQGRKGYEYLLTPVGRELSPIIVHMATWGMRWACGQLDMVKGFI